MKKVLLILGIVFLLNIIKGYSQNSIIIEDERIYRRISKEQLEKWKSEDPIQIIYLNYLYKDSYVIKNKQGSVSPNIDPGRTDIMNFDHARKENERISFIVSPWGDYIELKSKKEVETEFEKIKKEFHSSQE